MIKAKYMLYISTCLPFSSGAQASAMVLTYDLAGTPLDSIALHTHLHTPTELKPISSADLDKAIKLAAVCSLGGSCSGTGFRKDPGALNIDYAEMCKDNGYGSTSCPAGYVKDENRICPYSPSYFQCRVADNSCQSGFSLSTCNEVSQVEISSYKNEAGNSCYTCRDKTCEEGEYAAELTVCQNGTEIPFANKTCFTNVAEKSCEDGGYLSSAPENNSCTAISYCGLTCQSSCYQPECSEGGYLADCPTNHSCSETAYYGRTCYIDGGQLSCEDGGYLSSLPTDNVCSPVAYAGNSCYKDCYQPQCSDGGYASSQPSGQTCSQVSYYGRTCYTSCVDDCAGYTITDADCSAPMIAGGGSCGGKYKSCVCPSSYQYTSSNCDKNLGGGSCEGKYATCSCPAGSFIYTSSNCASPKAPSGASCAGKYTSCACPSEYNKTCSGSLQKPSGTACDGKYKACTQLTCVNWGRHEVSCERVCDNVGASCYESCTYSSYCITWQ